MSEHRNGERACEMIAAFRPVEAWIDDTASAASHRVGIDAHVSYGCLLGAVRDEVAVG